MRYMYMYMRFRKADKQIFARTSNYDLTAFGKFGKWRQISTRPS